MNKAKLAEQAERYEDMAEVPRETCRVVTMCEEGLAADTILFVFNR